MFEDIIIARYKAHKKHGINSLESGQRKYYWFDKDNHIIERVSDDSTLHFNLINREPFWDDKQNRILVKEIGEISNAINEFALGNISRVEYENKLHSEIVDSIAVLSAWADKIESISLNNRIEEFENIAGCSIEECI